MASDVQVDYSIERIVGNGEGGRSGGWRSGLCDDSGSMRREEGIVVVAVV